MPRKPAPMRWAVPPTPMKPGNARSFEVNSDDATEAKGGILHDRIRLPACVHKNSAAFMAAFVGHQGADQRQVLELLGHFRQDFRDLDAGRRGIDRLEFAARLLARLEVPQVHVAGAAAHPEDDEAFVFFLELGPRPRH